jgi:hypothetical protein
MAETPATPTAPLTREEADKLIKRARKGDAKCLPQLRAFFRDDEYGRRLLDTYGNPPAWVRTALARNAGGDDLAITEAMPAKLAQVQRELEGPAPTPLERLLAERAAVCWFLVNLYESSYAGAKNQTFRQAEYEQRKIDRAHGRFLSAVRTLAQVRKLALPALQVNIGAKQVNVAGG